MNFTLPCQPGLFEPRVTGISHALNEGLCQKEHLVNVAQVRQLSPFRYPGGKTWLVPQVRNWLLGQTVKPAIFVEPFAGGAMAGLTAGAEAWADHVLLSELDEDVAAVWSTIFCNIDSDIDWLCNQIASFQVTLEKVHEILNSAPLDTKHRAFRAIIKNRMQRGGIMAAGAGLVKNGESGRGLNSRWYPQTLVRRIQTLRTLRDRITFKQADAFEVIKAHAGNPNVSFFVDPPYTAGGKNAGRRLYTHSQIDHDKLFQLLASSAGSAMMTYDDAPEVRARASQYGFRVVSVPMKNTHHNVMSELLILKSSS